MSKESIRDLSLYHPRLVKSRGKKAAPIKGYPIDWDYFGTQTARQDDDCARLREENRRLQDKLENFNDKVDDEIRSSDFKSYGSEIKKLLLTLYQDSL